VRIWLALALASCQRQEAAPAGTGSGSSAGSHAADCALVVARVQAAVQTQIDAVGNDAKILITRMMPAMKDACVEDHWPVALTDCIIHTTPGDRAALEQCNTRMPKDLQDKLQKRMLKLAPLGTPPGSPAPAAPATP
jgi:hypothetical protein